MAIEVMLDIFSGRPNPVWVLDSARDTQVLSRLEALPLSTHAANTPEPPGLGYRGFILEGQTLSEPVRVYRGTVWNGDQIYLDPDRGLERSLLETAGTFLDENLAAVVRRDLDLIS